MYDSVELETEVAAAARRSDDDQVRGSRALGECFCGCQEGHFTIRLGRAHDVPLCCSSGGERLVGRRLALGWPTGRRRPIVEGEEAGSRAA